MPLTPAFGAESVEGNYESYLAAVAESLVRLGLTTSKLRTYAPPRPKRIRGWPPA